MSYKELSRIYTRLCVCPIAYEDMIHFFKMMGMCAPGGTNRLRCAGCRRREQAAARL
jgi:hypothetical protein